MPDRVLIVPAAGAGSRLNPLQPKLLVPVNGRPMLEWIIGMYEHWVGEFVVVVHPSFLGEVGEYTRALKPAVELVIQQQRTGMLDGILAASDAVSATRASRVWITWCDQIAVRPETIGRLAEHSDAGDAAPLVMPTARVQQPYVHLERDAGGRITTILHRREGDEMPMTGESDIGLFSLSRDAYLLDLHQYAREAEAGPISGERNFLPFIPWLARRSHVMTFSCADAIEPVGINTPEDLETISAHLAASRQTGH